MHDPAYRKRAEEGPVGFVRILPPGRPSMAVPMLVSVLHYLVIGVVVAYLTSRTLAPGADYLAVFRVAGVIAWCAYFFAAVPDAIWFGKPWTSVAKLFVESLVYATVTAGVFGSLWPGG
jgi:ABC-type Co2+ transport system permease subunit